LGGRDSLPHLAYIGLGSNLEDPEAQVTRALAELDGLAQTRVSARSSLYRTPPMGPPGQPDYINAAAALETALRPHALLDALQALEQQHARVRREHWGPRTLDLDILLYDACEIADERLTVPHAGIGERAFVLLPLAEIAPSLEIPGRGPLVGLLGRVDTHGISRL
jgi:2-amino-4-hydroxy-6-hydroxymethyldihydropteridine diphosphokinase